MEAYFEGKTSLEELKKSQSERVDPGNAPPMRALPLAFLELEEVGEAGGWLGWERRIWPKSQWDSTSPVVILRSTTEIFFSC